MNVPSLAELQEVAGAHGIDALGVARAEIFASTLEDLVERKERGLSADMQFTYRNPQRSTDPTKLVPGAQSLVVGARSYLRDAGDPVPEVEGPAGAVARYVWEDHYQQLRVGLEAVADLLRGHGYRARLVIDDNALVDREAAHRAGLGWYGKNANLLLPGKGSWFVLGSVATDAVLPPGQPLSDGCGTCERCLPSCPTGAIVSPGVIDARRCLAWLVQAKGTFPAEHREALGQRIYGCDDCQEVCPPNRVQARRPVEISNAARRPFVGLLDILSATDQELLDRYGVWYIPGREARYLRRNALVALGNTGSDDALVRRAVKRYLGHSDPMLRAHAVWAAKRLGVVLPAALQDDPAVEVRAEVQRAVTPAPVV